MAEPASTHETIPVWGANERTHPVAEPTDADVVVIGAGITGLTTALLARRHGARVVVVEAHAIGAGTSGRTTAKISALQHTLYQRIGAHHGTAGLRGYADWTQRAQEWITKHATSTGVPYHRADAVTYANSPDAVSRLTDEARAMARAGLPAQWTEDDVGLPFVPAAALVLADQWYVEPQRYLHSVARELLRTGPSGIASLPEATLFEGSRATHVRGGSTCRTTVRTDTGDEVELRSDSVVVATLLPFLDRAGLFARTVPQRSYLLSARINGDAPHGMYISADEPTRSLRRGRESSELLVGGNGHLTGAHGSASAQHDDLERWSAQDYASVDGLPFVGHAAGTGRGVLVACGFSKWGVSAGTAAAMQLAEQLAGTGEPAWSPNARPRQLNGLLGLARANGEAALRLGTGWAGALASSSPGASPEPAKGEGRVVREGRCPVAISRTGGEQHRVSAVCTHLGGILRWNDAARSWDCPLHGSRFSAAGEVLEGPAVRNLDPQ